MLYCVQLIQFGALAQPSHHWGPRPWKSLVTFGNSYTDEGRVEYFLNHNGDSPPVGWDQPVGRNSPWTGGYVWPHFASIPGNLTRYNYAVAGAMCSNNITQRYYAPIGALYPSVLEYEIPAYVADSKYVTPSGKKFMEAAPDETVYAIWIGTNDLGTDGFLTDSQINNTTISDYIDCVYQALDAVYANGGRYFVIMNLAPLQLTPQYSDRGEEVSGCQDKNATETKYRMWESVVTVNDVYRYRTPYEGVIARRYPGAKLAVMDMYGLISDIYYNPTRYLAAPANVTGWVKHCDANGENCQRLPNEASYLWFDELHPSERTDKIIGEEFVKVVEGSSQWADYW
ncbi:hypothetical protein BJX61DRAFT_532241 [Aspergillus egyptiacus]|nr:hypothetical protein BJX61DRAFT_532241 [Aspergillus egyptiacus]